MARVSTIPAGVPFVDALAAGLLAESSKMGSEGDALALADMLVLLPNRRACRSLRDAFWRAGKGQALALPAIQPIGDLDPDDLLLDAESELDLPPAIDGLKRRLLLTRLLMRARALDLTADQSGRLAEDLAGLLDELQTERVPVVSLDDLVPEAFAEHWQRSLEILQIIGHHWPAVLEDEGVIDPAERRHRVLTAIAERWMAAPPARRIVAAGSTGSIPATQALLGAVASLPNGEVVLPGLDRDLDDPNWAALTPQHPQHGLKQLLDELGVARISVRTWQAVDDRQHEDFRPRSGLLGHVMRPSGLEGGWQTAIDPVALDGLTLAEHADPAAEALFITLRLRAALLEEGRTAALITPDRALARRVVVELRRFGIEIDDTAGVPLDRTAPGSFLLLTARLLLDDIRPVALLSVLKHPLMRAGLPADVVRRRARALDRLVLRGPVIIGGFRQIIGELNDRRAAIAAHGEEQASENELVELRDWLESLASLAEPLAALMSEDEVPLDALVLAHMRFVEALAAVDGSAEALWAKEAGEAAAALVRDLLDAAHADDRLPPKAYPAFLAGLMTARLVRPKRPAHPRLTILGQLEARLQWADLTVIASLNEGVWPRVAEPGPWLNPSMRDSLGLPALERRIGQAAHDFVQAAAGGEVVLSRADKDLDGSPTVPSRWLVRLKALLDGQLDEGWTGIAEKADWRQWASNLDQMTDRPRPAEQPKPKPPVSARPRELSVSDVGLWMTDAYALYAKRILKLKPLEALEGDPEAGDRGTIIHEALERFVRAYPDALPEDALRRLRECGQRAFARFKQRPQVQALWWPRFLQAAAWVVAEEEGRRDALANILVEVKGELVIEAPAGPFRLTARADRVERRRDGGVVIVDYKTGKPPGKPEMALGRAPQLPLEGAILESGCFAGIDGDDARVKLSDLQFWQLAGGEQGGKLERRSPELVAEALTGLAALVAHYDSDSTPYPAAYRPPTAGRRGDYDHLARLGEWPN
ncbi:MAG: double-strand break repair protein AddB [Pseudomonadota bacterium]